MSWQELAKAIPLFEGALLTTGDRVREVLGRDHYLVSARNFSYTLTQVPDGPGAGVWRRRVWTFRRGAATTEVEAPVLDLEDRMTANEALCRLALRLGASANAVEEGVVFYLRTPSGIWTLRVAEFAHQFYGTDGITDRPTAIATAWIEAHQ